MAQPYWALRQYVNSFQPSFKLIDKIRDGGPTVKRYSPPATPCHRVIRHEAVGPKRKRSSPNTG